MTLKSDSFSPRTGTNGGRESPYPYPYIVLALIDGEQLSTPLEFSAWSGVRIEGKREGAHTTAGGRSSERDRSTNGTYDESVSPLQGSARSWSKNKSRRKNKNKSVYTESHCLMVQRPLTAELTCTALGKVSPNRAESRYCIVGSGTASVHSMQVQYSAVQYSAV